MEIISYITLYQVTLQNSLINSSNLSVLYFNYYVQSYDDFEVAIRKDKMCHSQE